MKKAFDEGWGGVIVKTLSLDAGKVVNVTPRYAKLRDASGAVFGWENIELISDRWGRVCICVWGCDGVSRCGGGRGRAPTV